MDLKISSGLTGCLLLVSACSEPTSVTVDSGTGSLPQQGTFTLSLPGHLSSVRAINLDALYAEVTIDGRLSTVKQGTPITTTFSVTGGETLDLQVQWFEEQQNEAPLLLTSWSRSQRVTEDITINVASTDYTSTGAQGSVFDVDGDGFSNLEELRADSDPYNTASTPLVRPDVRIQWVNPVEVPVIDGLYDSIWDRAQFSDVDGEQLSIDNLMINQGAVRPDGDTEFRWFAMHDDSNLYVFVLGEDVDTGTPIRDSTAIWQDDAVNLYIDGNNSKGSSYDGVDDWQLMVPLLASPENPVGNSTVFTFGENSATGAGFEFASCLCSSGQHTWEFKLPLSAFNIQKDVPFGFEVQIDEDNDGGARDARWGWFHPSRTNEDIDFTWTTPSYMGTAVVE